MPITTRCPGCNALFQLPDDLAGESVRCEKCAQVFEVPAAEAAEPAPTMEEVSQPEPPSAAESPPEEVVLASVADPAAPTVMPPPLPSAPAVPSPRPASGLALLLLFLIGVFGVGAFAIAWIATHLGPPVRISAATPIQIDNPNPGIQQVKIGFGKKDGLNKGKLPLAQPRILQLVDGRAHVNGITELAAFQDHGKWSQDGPYALFQANLQQGTTYHFHVNGINFVSRLRIVDPDGMQVADQWAVIPANRFMLAVQPKRTGNHLLWITTQNRVAGNFTLSIALETRAKPSAIDFVVQPNYLHHSFLRFEDPLDPTKNHLGPYRDYEATLDAGKDYVFAVSDAPFAPRLHIRLGAGIWKEFAPDPNARRLDATYRADVTGRYQIRVTSEQFGLGNYTLRAGPRPVALETILGAVDGEGNFTDQRELRPSDPKLLNQGVYKAYLLELEKGKKYRIEMSLGNEPTSVTLFDPNQNLVANQVGKENASVSLTAALTGMYRVRVAAPLPKDGAKYTLRISTIP